MLQSHRMWCVGGEGCAHVHFDAAPFGVTAAAGLPQSVAKTKQALTRGYAVAAMSSLDRSTGGGGRCFAWADDAAAAADALRSLRSRLRLPPGARIFVNGASSGGSLGLRLPSIVAFNGAVGGEAAPCSVFVFIDQPGAPCVLGLCSPLPPAVGCCCCCLQLQLLNFLVLHVWRSDYARPPPAGRVRSPQR